MLLPDMKHTLLPLPSGRARDSIRALELTSVRLHTKKRDATQSSYFEQTRSSGDL